MNLLLKKDYNNNRCKIILKCYYPIKIKRALKILIVKHMKKLIQFLLNKESTKCNKKIVNLINLLTIFLFLFIY